MISSSQSSLGFSFASYTWRDFRDEWSRYVYRARKELSVLNRGLDASQAQGHGVIRGQRQRLRDLNRFVKATKDSPHVLGQVVRGTARACQIADLSPNIDESREDHQSRRRAFLEGQRTPLWNIDAPRRHPHLIKYYPLCGKGSMSSVYFAGMQAMKVWNEWGNYPTLALSGFFREMELAGLYEGGIQVYDFGRVRNNNIAGAPCPMIHMEYLPSIGFDNRLEGKPTDELKSEIEGLIRTVADLHTLDYVHADINPMNLGKRRNGSWVLFDFGLTRTSRESQFFPKDSHQCGTQEFMPPDFVKDGVFDGKWRHTKATDTYALAATIFSLFTGSSETSYFLSSMKNGTTSAAKMQIPPFLHEFLYQALSDRPFRYQDANEMLSEFLKLPITQVSSAA